MRNKIKSNLRSMAFASVLTFAFLFVTNFTAFAQENVNGKYKVGERVECDFKFNGEYKQGTVVEVVGKGDENTCCRYRVKIDNDDPLWKDGRLCQERVVRALGGAQTEKPNQNKTEPQKTTTPKTTPNKPADKQKVEDPEDFTYLADREILDCPVEQTQVKNGAKPNAELLKKVVRCLFERRAPAGMDGAKTVDITAFQIGAARKWRPLDDIGSGNTGTIVYPIKVTWTEKTFYQSYTQQIDSISIFNCYVNAVGEWECGLGQRIKESDIKRLPRQE